MSLHGSGLLGGTCSDGSRRSSGAVKSLTSCTDAAIICPERHARLQTPKQLCEKPSVLCGEQGWNGLADHCSDIGVAAPLQ
jgi:hypothetical protein